MTRLINRKAFIIIAIFFSFVYSVNAADVIKVPIAEENAQQTPRFSQFSHKTTIQSMREIPLFSFSNKASIEGKESFLEFFLQGFSERPKKGVDALVFLTPKKNEGPVFMPIHDYSSALVQFDSGFPSVLKAVTNKNIEQDFEEIDLSGNSESENFENSKTMNPAASSLQIPFRIETRTEMTDKNDNSRTLIIETFISDGYSIEYRSRKEEWEEQNNLTGSKDILDKSKDTSLRRLRNKLRDPVPKDAQKISEDIVLNLDADLLEIRNNTVPHQKIWVAEHPMLGRFIIKKMKETPNTLQIMEFSQIQFGEDVATDLYNSPVSIH